jgi:hypothetical protein
MASLQEQEIELWKKWRYNNDQEALEQLMKSLRPIVKSIAGPWNKSGLPQAVIEGEVKKNILEALDEYDPSFGVQLNTFIISRSRKLNRLVYKHQNVGRISEQRITQIGTFNNVKQFLTDKHGREPSSQQMADELAWSPAEVERMELESRKDIFSSSQVFEPGLLYSDREKEILDLLYYELTPEEQTIYDYLLGKNGKPMLKANEIATRLMTNPAKISRIRDKIQAKFHQYS